MKVMVLVTMGRPSETMFGGREGVRATTGQGIRWSHRHRRWRR